MNTKGRHRRDSDEIPPALPVQDVQVTPKKPRRWFVWLFMVVQVVFLLWVVGGARTGAGTPQHCGMLSQHDCNTAQNLGTAFGVGLVIVFWAIVNIMIGVTFGVVRFTRRS